MPKKARGSLSIPGLGDAYALVSASETSNVSNLSGQGSEGDRPKSSPYPASSSRNSSSSAETERLEVLSSTTSNARCSPRSPPRCSRHEPYLSGLLRVQRSLPSIRPIARALPREVREGNTNARGVGRAEPSWGRRNRRATVERTRDCGVPGPVPSRPASSLVLAAVGLSSQGNRGIWATTTRTAADTPGLSIAPATEQRLAAKRSGTPAHGERGGFFYGAVAE
jgi:hypothetical protein